MLDQLPHSWPAFMLEDPASSMLGLLGPYAAWRGPDGLPVDPWLRVHERAGGRIVKACPASMVVPGTLAQWREWTGLPFDRSGDLLVPGTLAPVHVSVEHDHAVYVEANAWVRHRL